METPLKLKLVIFLNYGSFLPYDSVNRKLTRFLVTSQNRVWHRLQPSTAIISQPMLSGPQNGSGQDSARMSKNTVSSPPLPSSFKAS